MQLTVAQKATCTHNDCNSHLSAGPVFSGSGIRGSGWPGSCTPPAPAHTLVYMKSEIHTKALISQEIYIYTSFLVSFESIWPSPYEDKYNDTHLSLYLTTAII